MEKGELLEYLAAVCDAENAIYACDEAITALQQQEQGFIRLSRPYPPKEIKEEYHSYKYEQESKSDKMFLHVFRVLFFISFFFIFSLIPGWLLVMDLVFSFLLTATVGTFLGGYLQQVLLINKRVDKTNNQIKISTEERNRRAQEDYFKEMEKYNKACIIEEKVYAELNKEIFEKQKLRDSLKDQLYQLYAMDIIYPTFRNMVAVNQIREYIAMGVCDALEGPDGAYAQYLQDVRTNKICDSITDLRDNLMSALGTFAMTQATLVNELRQTNSNIQEINQSLNHGLSEMQRSLQAAQNATAGQFEAYMQQANSSLEKIEQSTSTAAYNQYIALRQSNVRKYLLKELQ